jgi:hypothetical protein
MFVILKTSIYILPHQIELLDLVVFKVLFC